MRKETALIFAMAVITACAPIRQESVVSTQINTDMFASVGDVMLRVDVREDLPNVFGRADLYGRTRDRGFSEVRYLGVTPHGTAVFRRRDVDIITNEDTMNRSGFGSAVVAAQPLGDGYVVSGVSNNAPTPNVQPLPPDSTQFEMDLAAGRIITIRGKTIEVLEATSSGVRFVVR